MPGWPCKQKAIIFSAWAVIQIILFSAHGIMITGEAKKYIREAGILLNKGHYSTPNFLFYSVEIFALALDKLVSANLLLALSLHLVLSLVATFSFFGIARQLFGRHQALFCTLLLLINLPYQQFNVMMQTESLYFSLSVILTATAFSPNISLSKKMLLISALVLLLTFCRPTGALFLVPLVIFLLLTYGKSFGSVKKVVIIGGFLFVCAAVTNLAMSSGGELDFMTPFLLEHIICGVATLPDAAPIRITTQGNSFFGLFYYIFHNPAHFITLAAKRTAAFFGLVRNYYSTGHNAFLTIYFYPLYIMALFGMRFLQDKPVRAYLLAVIVIVWATTMLTCDDWHNRFLISISPYLILLGWPAISKIFTATTRRRNNN